MSRSRYTFYFEPAWQRAANVRWIFGVVGASLVGLGGYMAYATLWGVGTDYGFIPGQFVFYGLWALLIGTGLYERYLSYYVDITLGRVRWRLPDSGEGFFSRYRPVRLAEVERIEIGLLHIGFELLDGSHERLPLGSVPYEAVQEIKRRFEGRASLAGVTGGAVRERTPIINII